MIPNLDWYIEKAGFWRWCGTRLDLQEWQRGYSQTSGLPIILVYARCPRKRWWNSHQDWYAVLPPPPVKEPKSYGPPGSTFV